MLLNTVTSTVHFVSQVKSQGNCDDGGPVKLLRKERRNRDQKMIVISTVFNTRER